MTIQLKTQIRDIKKPPVWRRIVIPGDFSFHDLHNTIQAAFGWWNERRNDPCPCGSGKKYKNCCGRGN